MKQSTEKEIKKLNQIIERNPCYNGRFPDIERDIYKESDLGIKLLREMIHAHQQKKEFMTTIFSAYVSQEFQNRKKRPNQSHIDRAKKTMKFLLGKKGKSTYKKLFLHALIVSSRRFEETLFTNINKDVQTYIANKLFEITDGKNKQACKKAIEEMIKKQLGQNDSENAFNKAGEIITQEMIHCLALTV